MGGYLRQQSGSRTVLATMFTILTGAASSGPMLDVSGLIGPVERGCQLSKMLERFRLVLNTRYTFEEGAVRPDTSLDVPKPFGAAIGHIEAFDRGDHTEIVVLLRGTYRGLPTRSISFRIGHSNGINVTTLAFTATTAEVERVLGPATEASQRAFQTDPDLRLFGFSVRIVSQTGGSALVCNMST